MSSQGPVGRWNAGAYPGFWEVRELLDLWNEASAGRQATDTGFDGARDAFWRRVNGGRDPRARSVGALIDQLGFKLRLDKQAPVYRLLDGKVAAEVLEAAGSRLVLSIDHIRPRDRGGAVLDPLNLTFMTARDNAEKRTWMPGDPTTRR